MPKQKNAFLNCVPGAIPIREARVLRSVPLEGRPLRVPGAAVVVVVFLAAVDAPRVDGLFEGDVEVVNHANLFALGPDSVEKVLFWLIN